jgi:hypothetical protein
MKKLRALPEPLDRRTTPLTTQYYIAPADILMRRLSTLYPVKPGKKGEAISKP